MISRRTRGSPRTNKYTEIHLWLGQLLSCELLVLLTACKYTEQGGFFGLLCYFRIFILPTRECGARREPWVLVKKDGFIPIQFCHLAWHRVTDACSVLLPR